MILYSYTTRYIDTHTYICNFRQCFLALWTICVIPYIDHRVDSYYFVVIYLLICFFVLLFDYYPIIYVSIYMIPCFYVLETLAGKQN